MENFPLPANEESIALPVTVILPGETIGILGGGQLGRMLAQTAASMGYHVHIFDEVADNPATEVAVRSTIASYANGTAMAEFAQEVHVITYEFENIPAGALEPAVGLTPLYPNPAVLHICQNRQREKAWLKKNHFPHVAYAEALDGDIVAAVAELGRPAVVKTADFGYDGKGQMKIGSEMDLEQAAAIFRGRRCVVEQWCDYSCELSVIVARGANMEVRAFPAVENIHREHILDFSIAPGRFSAEIAKAAESLAIAVAEKLNVVGLLAVEFFLTGAGELIINELAPRPHNSGHWTLDGCETSQFEQHLRAICGLPLGSVEVREPTVMVNILGETWKKAGGEIAAPDWSGLLRESRVKLHLYGKREPRRGRKMGHFTVRDSRGAEAALATARELQSRFLL